MNKILGQAWEITRFALITLAIVIPIRTFIAQPFVVSGASMHPTFENGEYLVIDELSYYLRPPERGEVIVFRYPNDTTKHFIKRIIGLPGETIVIRENLAYLKTGETLKLINQDYLDSTPTASPNLAIPETEKTLKSGEYFVMGDNRTQSLDSRSWGALPQKLITGRVLARLLPLNRISLLP